MLPLRRFLRSGHSAHVDAGLASLLFFGTFAVYLQTMRRSFGWGDPSELATAAYFLGIGHSPGYPTYMLIAYLFAHLPVSTVAVRMNLMSAFFGSVAVVLSYFVFRRVCGSRFGAFLGAASFAFTASFWDVTTDAEVHTLHVALIAAIILLLLKWRASGRPHLAWPALLCGLSLGNHALTALVIPALLIIVVAARGWRFLFSRSAAGAYLACLLGVSVYAYLAIRGPANPPPGVNNPQNLQQVLIQITAPGARESMFSVPLATVLLRIGQFWLHRLPLDVTWPGVILGLIGIPVLARTGRTVLATLLTILALNVLYSVNFSIFDIYAYFIVSYWVWCAFIAAGGRSCASLIAAGIAVVQRAEDSLRGRARLALAGMLLLALPFWIATGHWRLVDASGDRSAEQFARATLAHVEPNALILGDWWPIAPLGYLKYVERLRPDTTLWPAFSFSNKTEMIRHIAPDKLREFPAVYAAEMQTYGMAELRKRYIVINEGPVWRVFTKGPEPERVLSDYRGAPRFVFGGRFALVGWDIRRSNARPGVPAPMTLYWRPLQTPKTAVQYQVMVAFERTDESGRLQTAWRDKGPLANGMLPLAEWQPNQTAAERHSAFITSEDFLAGQYDVTVRVRQVERNRVSLLPVTAAAGSSVDRRAVIGRIVLEETPGGSAPAGSF